MLPSSHAIQLGIAGRRRRGLNALAWTNAAQNYGEIHVELRGGGTMPLGDFMYLHTAHIERCEKCSKKRAIRGTPGGYRR